LWFGRRDRYPCDVRAARIALVNALRHVVVGGDLTKDALRAIVADPASLGGTERKAWYVPSHWADDDDIRITEPHLAADRRVQLAELSGKLGHS